MVRPDRSVLDMNDGRDRDALTHDFHVRQSAGEFVLAIREGLNNALSERFPDLPKWFSALARYLRFSLCGRRPEFAFFQPV